LSVLADEEFRRGAVATNFLGLRGAHLSFGESKPGDLDAVFAAAWCATRSTSSDALWADSRGWRLAGPPLSIWVFAGRSVSIEFRGQSRYVAYLGGQEYPLRIVARGAASMDIEAAGQIHHLRVIETAENLHLLRGGREAVLRPARTDDALAVSAVAEQGSLLTPLPGTVVAVHVTAGQHVTRGAPLVTVEAMKMEHTLSAPYDGTVTRVPFGLAERVAAGAILVELSPLDA